MSSHDLVGLIDSWSDVLTLSELLSSPFLRVGASWDLQDWRAVDWDDGVQFQRLDPHGQVVENFLVIPARPEKEKAIDPTAGRNAALACPVIFV